MGSILGSVNNDSSSNSDSDGKRRFKWTSSCRCSLQFTGIVLKEWESIPRETQTVEQCSPRTQTSSQRVRESKWDWNEYYNQLHKSGQWSGTDTMSGNSRQIQFG